MHTTQIRVTRAFTFDMAHALYGHDGPCKNIHGHTYKLHVTVVGSILQKENNAKDGMVADFGDLKKLVQREILNDFDHALLLNGQAPYRNSSSLLEEFEKVILFPFQPSCENILVEFHRRLSYSIHGHLRLCAVKLEETPTSSAEWRSEDNTLNR